MASLRLVDCANLQILSKDAGASLDHPEAEFGFSRCSTASRNHTIKSMTRNARWRISVRIHYNDPLGMITNDPSTLEKLRMADNSGSHSSGRDRSYFVVNQKNLPYKSFIESFHETFKISKTLITKINNVWVRI